MSISFGPAGVVVPSLDHGTDLVSIYPPLVLQIINEISDFYELINSMAMHTMIQAILGVIGVWRDNSPHWRKLDFVLLSSGSSG